MVAKTTVNRHKPLILASTSRYRRALLTQLGVPFDVMSPDVDETPLANETPRATALRLSEAKARAIAARHADALVIGADQVADLDGRPIGKPGDYANAFAQLRVLSGQTVVFHTGVALCDAATGRCTSRLVDVTSGFSVLADAEIDSYRGASGPDCAGSVRSEALLSRCSSVSATTRADRIAADCRGRPPAGGRDVGARRAPRGDDRTHPGRRAAPHLVPNLLGRTPSRR
jgi:septum formation protein